MLSFFVGSLTIALISLYISFKTTEEIVQLSTLILAVFCFFLSIIASPLAIKLVGIIALLIHPHLISKTIETNHLSNL